MIEPPVPCGDHPRADRCRKQRGGTQIHRDRGVEQSGVGLGGRLRMRNARVVHQNVQSAERIAGASRQFLRAVRLGEVDGGETDLAPELVGQG